MREAEGLLDTGQIPYDNCAKALACPASARFRAGMMSQLPSHPRGLSVAAVEETPGRSERDLQLGKVLSPLELVTGGVARSSEGGAGRSNGNRQDREWIDIDEPH